MRNFVKEAKLLAIVFCYSGDWLSTNISQKFISCKWICFISILKYNYEPSAPPLSLKSKIFYVRKSQCCGTMKFMVVLMWSITYCPFFLASLP